MFNQTKFFKVTFLFAVFLLVVLYGFTAGAWDKLDAAKELYFELTIHRIFYASRYSLALMPVLSTAIFTIIVLLVTKDRKVDNTKPYVIKKLLCTLMIEFISSQLFIQFLLIIRSISVSKITLDYIIILYTFGAFIILTSIAVSLYSIFIYKFRNKKSA